MSLFCHIGVHRLREHHIYHEKDGRHDTFICGYCGKDLFARNWLSRWMDHDSSWFAYKYRKL